MIAVAPEESEIVRARLLDVHPEGFEEAEGALVAYTDAAGEEQLRAAFSVVDSQSVEPGWEERWREFHQPSWVGPIWLGPPWHEPPRDALAIVVDPGRAFGTGSHPTTRLCLELLLDAELGSLVDVGCGSGILAIAAAKLGFAPVTALDRDPAALEATRRNAVTNDVTIDVQRADVRVDALPQADLAIANIDLATVEAVGARADAATLITAGYFHSREPALREFEHVERRIDGGWAADRWARRAK